MTYDFFLSYRRTDQALAGALVKALEARGARVWWDNKINGGRDWRDAIADNLEASNALIILFSEECNSSKQLRKELALADAMDKLVVPILVEPIQPRGHFLYELAALNWIQIHPNPMTKIDLLADRLVSEFAIARDAATPEVPEGAKPADLETWDAISKTVARKIIAAKAAKPLEQTQTRSFLPFKRYEILAVMALAGLAAGAVSSAVVWAQILTLYWAPGVFAAVFASVGFALIFAIAGLIFPYRYAHRQLRVLPAYFYQVANLACLTGFVPLCLLTMLQTDVFDWFGKFNSQSDVLLLIAAWALSVLMLALLSPIQVMLTFAERKLYQSMLARIERL